MTEPRTQPDPRRALTVSAFAQLARQAIEASLPLVWVEGEVSNFMRAASGHWYFSLKDAQAQVRCVMFRSRNQFCDFVPANGDAIAVRAMPTLYEARGDFQLGVETLRRADGGELFRRFLALKAELEALGWFDATRKRALPAFARTIGVVTSPQAAALRDVLSAIGRRMPAATVILYPAPVQGREAPEKLAEAIRTAASRAECDVLLVVRGGGSMEDLWAFNAREVVEAIVQAPMPVVSGVGHETDFTLADFAADVRAPTPTAAAELVSLDTPAQQRTLSEHAHRLARAMRWRLGRAAQACDSLASRLAHPAERLGRQTRHLDTLAGRLDRAASRQIRMQTARLDPLAARLHRARYPFAATRERVDSLGRHLGQLARLTLDRQHTRLHSLSAALEHLAPERVLERGYCIALTPEGRVADDAGRLAPGDALELVLRKGRAHTRVEAVSDVEKLTPPETP